MGDDNKKKGFLVVIGAIIVMVVGMLLVMFTGNDKLIQKAKELMGKSKANDKGREDAIKVADTTIKENNTQLQDATKIVEESKKESININERINAQIKENESVTTTKVDDVIKNNEKIIEENKKILGGK